MKELFSRTSAGQYEPVNKAWNGSAIHAQLWLEGLISKCKNLQTVKRRFETN